ncbi:hypothetical protein [Kingella potus]|uniref:hypothetical protein n=1 Tax=Kingella potus TaxID=265175 RepID=UPI001FCFDCE9|nr:hypothetical protein [Kingella potus]UOP01718.1 hypothetical protein LVJ84_06255 [Kingella potus]
MRPTLILAAALAAASAPLYAQSCREADAGLAAGYSEMQANGNYGGQAWSESRDRRLDAAEKRFSAKLAAYLARPASWGCAFPKLRAAGVETAAAADGKIRAFSWDRQNGGTMHNEETLLQYRSGGKTALRTGSGGAVRGITAARLPPYGTVYFVHYRFRASSRLYTDRTELLHIAKGRLKPLNIIRTSRLGNSLAYEADIAVRTAPARRQGKRPHCLRRGNAHRQPARGGGGKRKRRRRKDNGTARIRYRFDGRYFVLQR